MKKITFNKLAFKSIKAGKKKYIALSLSIFFAMTFLIGGLFFIACMNASTEELGYIARGKQDQVLLNAADFDFYDPSYSGYFDGKIGYMSVLSLDFLPDDEKMTNGVSVAKLDERAQELYYQKLLSGRMPETEGEIAVEKSVLVRMKLDKNVGDKITFKEKAANRDKFTDKTTERTYTIVGILKDRKTYLESFIWEGENEIFGDMLPSVFVNSSQKVAAGGKEILVALYNRPKSGEAYDKYNDAYETATLSNPNIQALYTRNQSNRSVSEENAVKNKSAIGIILCVLLAFMACFAIANTFAANLKDRKKLIGMLRAIGATKRQIVSLFLKETAILSIVLLPLAVLISYFCVKLFSTLMGESFIFVPNQKVWLALLSGVILSLFCVTLSAMIPLIGISHLSPMQAVRDIELMRKVKNKKIKSQKSFRASSLLAKRATAFSKGRLVGVTVILALTTVIICTCITYAVYAFEEKNEWQGDYWVRVGSFGSAEDAFCNPPIGKDAITDRKARECESLPCVSRVSGEKRVWANLLISGDIPEYLKLVDLESMNQRQWPLWDINDPSDDQNITEDNFEEVMYSRISPTYTEIKNKAGYDRDFLNVEIDTADVEKLKEYVTDGKINIEKINSGEEIIVIAPEEIGYFYYKDDKGNALHGIENLSADESKISDYAKEHRKHVVRKAKSCFKAGDLVTFSVLRNENGRLTRNDKTLRIGAVLGMNLSSFSEMFYTTVEGISTFGMDFEYDELNVYLDRECDAQIDEQMQNNLDAIFPGGQINSVFAIETSIKLSTQNVLLALFSIVAVFLCICITLINNSVNAQIREGKRTIGTLRAVGADEKELMRSYLLQILQSIAIGFVSGSVIYTVGFIIHEIIYDNGLYRFCLWAAVPAALITLIVCLINLKIRVKSVRKYSIVENIREL